MKAMSVDEKLQVVPEPAPGTATVFEPGSDFGDRPLVQGQDPNGRRYFCGSCGRVLVDSIGNNVEIRNIQFRCPSCRALNLANIP